MKKTIRIILKTMSMLLQKVLYPIQCLLDLFFDHTFRRWRRSPEYLSAQKNIVLDTILMHRRRVEDSKTKQALYEVYLQGRAVHADDFNGLMEITLKARSLIMSAGVDHE